MSDVMNVSCPLPLSHSAVITMAHGGGGKLSSNLINSVFKKHFQNAHLMKDHDGAILNTAKTRLAFSTDTFVVKPHFFPGGDIGKLAVIGTANDLAMCGARPMFLSCGFILEEGFSIDTLSLVASSMRRAADEVGIEIVTGDTKVVERGHGDGIYINTSGIGVVEHEQIVEPLRIQEGDAILLSGDIGRHGMAILSHREGLSFESELHSDCAHLWPAVDALLKANVDVHCLRDLTRGGLATGLIELAESCGHDFQIDETRISVCSEVRGASEILGLDPLYVANEGRFVVVVPQAFVECALSLLRKVNVSSEACAIGTVQSLNSSRGRVTIKSAFGTTRFVDKLSGEQLPRIC